MKKIKASFNLEEPFFTINTFDSTNSKTNAMLKHSKSFNLYPYQAAGKHFRDGSIKEDLKIDSSKVARSENARKLIKRARSHRSSKSQIPSIGSNGTSLNYPRSIDRKFSIRHLEDYNSPVSSNLISTKISRRVLLQRLKQSRSLQKKTPRINTKVNFKLYATKIPKTNKANHSLLQRKYKRLINKKVILPIMVKEQLNDNIKENIEWKDCELKVDIRFKRRGCN